MKTVKLLLVIVLSGAFGLTVSAQSPGKVSGKQKTETFKVSGKCDMCKSRIEKTVKAEGVSVANWDSKTQLLTVTFDEAKTSADVLGKKLALVGHDTEKFKASDEAYSKLPGCCHYERTK